MSPTYAAAVHLRDGSVTQAGLLEVPHNGVDLWLIATAELRDASLLRRYGSLLSDDERRQQVRFHFERDRHRYLVTRAALRLILSRYATTEPQHWQFSSNAYGRPRIADRQAAAGLSFNLSHTEGLITVGISAQHAIGVDVENVVTREVSLSVADHYFSPGEASALRALALPQQQERFYELWTLKEAYIKARGMGLSIPLNQFWFDLDRHTSRVEIGFDATMQEAPSFWHFWQFDAGPQHLGAVCIRRAASLPCLRVRQFTPCSTDRPVQLRLRRTSSL